ncbi:GNAT family N-acetyltransferase [Streptomyces sp. NPDC021224]|uniref:bifunctional acetate--CoA ligase family protein/GNAT family N-acetyltransferase n=1 Tax=unclassified Streptomyces TaxID=2593676 RepID=UPI0037ADB87B
MYIRVARPEDHAGLLELYGEMSRESLRSRFFGVTRRAGEVAAEWVLAPPRTGHAGLVAVHGDRIVGTAEYEVTADPRVAEVSVAVADDFHRRGVGTLLVEHLANAAREAGVERFTADTLASNHLMQRLVADLGQKVERRHEDGEVHVTFPLAPDERYLAAVERRGSTADLASLRPLLRPRSVAVIGAGTSAGSVGRAVLRNILDGGFTGRVYAVNPHAHAVLRTPCFAAVEDLPHPPDLAVVAVPAAAVPEVAEQCGTAGVGALVVLSAGLGPEEGAALLGACRRHGMRLVGPNCLGVAVTGEHTGLNATFAAHRPPAGGAGVAVQSGGVGMALLDGLARLGTGVSEFVSLGDKFDVSGNDMLQFWEADGGTSMALLHLESFGNPRAFSRTARRVARRMPVLTVDAGRSGPGRRAAASHTAAAATATVTRQALFHQAGITATRTIAELLDTAALLDAQPLPAGARTAVVSNAGGAAVLAADACAEAGLVVPEFPADLTEGLLGVLPDGAKAGNPVDATATVGEQPLSDCLDLLTRHDAVDAVVVALVPTALAAATGDDPWRALTNAAPGSRPRPVVSVLLGQAEQVRMLHGRDGARLPSYADPQSAARALARAGERARWLARSPGTRAVPAGTDPTRARALVDGHLAESPDGGWLDPDGCAALLACYGIPQARTELTATEDLAAAAARTLAGDGERVALKAYWAGLTQEPVGGAVRPDLRGEDEVRDAFRELAGRFADRLAGVVVQPAAPRGVEFVAGVVQDGVFGPLVLLGPGDTAADALADRAARLAPLTDNDIEDLVAAPHWAPQPVSDTDAGEGAGPVTGAIDLPAVKGLLARLSAMACDLPQLAEAELDPVLARPDGVLAVGVRLRLSPARPSDPHLRRLP